MKYSETSFHYFQQGIATYILFIAHSNSTVLRNLWKLSFLLLVILNTLNKKHNDKNSIFIDSYFPLNRWPLLYIASFLQINAFSCYPSSDKRKLLTFSCKNILLFYLMPKSIINPTNLGMERTIQDRKQSRINNYRLTAHIILRKKPPSRSYYWIKRNRVRNY